MPSPYETAGEHHTSPASEAQLALDGLKSSLEAGSIFPLIGYLGTMLTHKEISTLAKVQQSTVTKWFEGTVKELKSPLPKEIFVLQSPF